MARRVLVVPDKFKGTLSAQHAARAISKGWAQARPQDDLELLPMADGGDGFGPVMGELLRAERRWCATQDCAGRARSAEWWWAGESNRVAVIEAAQVNGLAALPPGQFHPFHLDTFGLAAVLRSASDAGAQTLYVGLGGSATNDGGFGLARGLGWRFWAEEQREVLVWTGLAELVRVEPPPTTCIFPDLVVAVDVANPLLGSYGASAVYGPQKGLRAEEVPTAEACLGRLARVMRDHTREDWAAEAGAGAAGGLGFGLRAFAGGRYESGAALFARVAGLEQRIANADWVVTAEGSLDAQTWMGKGVGAVAEAAARAGKPCVCLAGSVASDAALSPWPGFQALGIVPDLATLDEAKSRPAEYLELLASRVAAQLE